MSNSSSNHELNNEQLLLVNILNTMYNDNIRQINNYTDSLNSLNDTNIQIRNLIFQILNPPITNNNVRRNIRQNQRLNTNRYRNTNPENSENSLGRIVLNNIPYTIENIEEYRIPLTRNINEINTNNYSQFLQNFFQPVEVFPTLSQIELATRIVRYSDIISPRNRSCPISLENFNDEDLVTVIRFCGHIFNTDEINTWFRSNCRCPVCRYDIRTYNSNLTTELFETNNTNTNSENNLNPTSNVNETTVNQEQNNISNNNSERNLLTNNNTNQSTPLRNRFLNSSTLQENDIINIFMDLSGNLLNNLTNSDSLLRLFNAVNNNYSN